jgi:hypothetical protein
MKINTRHITLVILMVTLSLLSLSGQAPRASLSGASLGDLEWSKTYGYANTDGAQAVVQANDLGYYVAGYTQSQGSKDAKIWVIKFNAQGNRVWDKYVGASQAPTFGYAVTLAPDGGCVAAGELRIYSVLDEVNLTSSYKYDMEIIKFSSSGSKVWEKHFGGTDYDRANAVITTKDGGYLMAGHTQSYADGGNPSPHAKKDAWIIKLSSSGSKQWQLIRGGSQGDGLNSVVQTSDGGYIAAGFTASQGAGSYDFYVMKVNSNGTFAWEKAYGGLYPDMANSIIQTSDGGYIVAGETWSFGSGNIDYLVYKLDSRGTVQWSKTYGGAGFERARAIRAIPGGGYLIAGFTDSSGAGGRDAWIVKIDASGNVLGSQTFGGKSCDEANGMAMTKDGGYVVAGNTSSSGSGEIDSWIMKFK